MSETTERIGAVVAGGIVWVEFDIVDAQEQSRVEYDGDVSGSVDLSIGDQITVAVAEDLTGEIRAGVRGFVVPDHAIAVFEQAFEDRGVYRRRGDE